MVEYVEAILYHKIQDSDFTNMYGVKKPASGGGQTYIQAAGYTRAELDRMFSQAQAVDTPEYWDPGEKKYPRKEYTIPARVVGSPRCEALQLVPRTGRKDYRICRQGVKLRHPAWSQANGFPAPEEDTAGKYRYEKNYPGKIDHLYIMIIKTRAGSQDIQYYAAYIDSKHIPDNWPKAAGLEAIFIGEKQGIIFYDEQFLRYTDDKYAPFAPGSAVDEELGLVPLPADLAERADDAVEYAGKELTLSVDTAKVAFCPVDPPAFKRRLHTTDRAGAVKDRDYARRQRNLKKVGDLGEALVVELEKRRLTQAGRNDLANRIEHVSKTVGDGLGYDILSFELLDEGYAEKLIEVKATTGGKNKPFDISANEVEVSEDQKERYCIYRLFGLRSGAGEIKYYEIRGSVKERFNLVPSAYKAFVK